MAGLEEEEEETVKQSHKSSKWRRGRTLAGSELLTVLNAKISALRDSGLAVLEIMDHYDVDLDDLRRIREC